MRCSVPKRVAATVSSYPTSRTVPVPSAAATTPRPVPARPSAVATAHPRAPSWDLQRLLPHRRRQLSKDSPACPSDCHRRPPGTVSDPSRRISGVAAAAAVPVTSKTKRITGVAAAAVPEVAGSPSQLRGPIDIDLRPRPSRSPPKVPRLRASC